MIRFFWLIHGTLPVVSSSYKARPGVGRKKNVFFSMVVSGSPNRWDRWHSPSPNWQEKYHLCTTYSPCLLGDCMLPTTFYGNQKQPLIFGGKSSYDDRYPKFGGDV